MLTNWQLKSVVLQFQNQQKSKVILNKNGIDIHILVQKTNLIDMVLTSTRWENMKEKLGFYSYECFTLYLFGFKQKRRKRKQKEGKRNEAKVNRNGNPQRMVCLYCSNVSTNIQYEVEIEQCV